MIEVREVNRLEIEIANHKMQAEACERLGNKEEARHKWFIYDCLSALKNIHETGDCNNCTHKNCGYLPVVGQMVRYNCPFYKKEGEEK